MSVARELADLPSASPSTDANFDNGTFVIDVSENRVGIGTTAPTTLLELAANTADDVKIRFFETGVSDAYITFDMSEDWLGFSQNGGSFDLGINTGSGNVGIGTSAPADFLHIEGTDAGLLIENAESEIRAKLYSDQSGDRGFLALYGDGTNTNVTQKVNINSNGDTWFIGGNFGIGTTAPVTALTVEGTITLKERAEADTNTATYGQLWVDNTAPNALYFTNDADTDIQLTTATGINAASTGKAIAMAIVFGG